MLKMKLKNLIGILFIITALLLSSNCASAWHKFPGVGVDPYPVVVFLDIAGIKMDSVSVETCNLRTGYCVEMQTNKEGEALFELGNFQVPETLPDKYLPPYMPSDEIQVDVCDNHPSCVQTFKVLGHDDEGYESREILHFIIAKEVPVEVEKIIESEKVVEVEGPETVIERLKEKVTIEELTSWQKFYPWFVGFCFGIITFFVGFGLTGKKRAIKMWKTVIRKFRAGLYKKRGR